MSPQSMFSENINYTVQLIQDRDSLLELHETWQERLSAFLDRPSFFQSPAFCQYYFDEAHQDICVLLIQDGERCIAILPLVISKKMGLKMASWLGSPITQTGALSVNAEEFKAVMNVAQQALREELHVDLLQLRRCFYNQDMQAEMKDVNVSLTNEDVAHFIDLKELNQFADYEAGLSSSTRKSRRRARKKLEENHTIEFNLYQSGQELADTVNQAIEMKRQSLDQKGDTSRAFLDVDTFKALTDLAARDNNPAGIVTSSLSVDGVAAAIEVGFLHQGRYYAYLGAMDSEFHHLRVGSYQIEKTIEWAITAGVEVFDFLPPTDPYKVTWAKEHAYTVADWQVPLSAKGLIMSNVLFKYGLPTVKKIFHKSPKGLRQFIQTVARKIT